MAERPDDAIDDVHADLGIEPGGRVLVLPGNPGGSEQDSGGAYQANENVHYNKRMHGLVKHEDRHSIVAFLERN